MGRQKHLLDIDIHFNDGRRSGGGRGRGPRSGPRGNRNNQRGERQQGSRYRGNEEQVVVVFIVTCVLLFMDRWFLFRVKSVSKVAATNPSLMTNATSRL